MKQTRFAEAHRHGVCEQMVYRWRPRRDSMQVRLLAPAACIFLSHQLGRPRRAIVDYTA